MAEKQRFQRHDIQQTRWSQSDWWGQNGGPNNGPGPWNNQNGQNGQWNGQPGQQWNGQPQPGTWNGQSGQQWNGQNGQWNNQGFTSTWSTLFPTMVTSPPATTAGLFGGLLGGGGGSPFGSMLGGGAGANPFGSLFSGFGRKRRSDALMEIIKQN